VSNFVSFAAFIAEVAHGEKSRTQSINQSPSFFDARGTEAFASEITVKCKMDNDSRHKIIEIAILIEL